MRRYAVISLGILALFFSFPSMADSESRDITLRSTELRLSPDIVVIGDREKAPAFPSSRILRWMKKAILF